MKRTFIVNGEEIIVDILDPLRIVVAGEECVIDANELSESYVLNNNVLFNTYEVLVEERSRARSAATSKPQGHIAPMPGRIIKILVAACEEVKAGRALLVMEAMKLQINIEAAYDGIVATLNVQAGDVVEAGKELVEITRKTTAPDQPPA